MYRTRTVPLAGLLTTTMLGACAHGEPPAAPPAPASAEPGALAERVVEEPAAPAPAPRQLTPRLVAHSGAFLEPLQTAITSFGAAGAGSTIYVLGGYSGVPHAYSREGQSDVVWSYDTRGGAGWQKIATMSQALQGVPAVHHAGRVCYFGGSHASNEPGTPTVMTSVSTSRCLTLADGTWSELPVLPVARSSHAAALVGSTIYVVGGWTLNPGADGGTFATDVLTLDLTRPSAGWQAVLAPFSRRALGVAAVGKKLVVVGGMTSAGKPSGAVDVYDTVTKKWSSGPDFPGDAFGIAVTTDGTRVLASGRDGELRALTPGQKAWTSVKKLAYGRFFHQLVPVEGDVVVVGGIGGMHTRGRTRAIERVSLKDGLRYGQMTFEYPGIAKNRQGILLRGEEVLLFGGNDSLEQHDFAREHFESEAWIFDLATLEFRETTPFPFRRQSMQVLATSAGGVAIGGFGHEPLVGDATEAVSHRDIVRFDWDKATWSVLPPLPRGRTQFGIAEGDGEAWILGGLNYDPARKQAAFEHDRTLWRASLADFAFQEVDVQLPGPRRAFAGAMVDGKYVMIGGMKEGFELVSGCVEFDPSEKTFADFPCPEPRLSGDLIPAGGKLYLVGGSVQTKDGIVESRQVEVYDPKTRKWSSTGFEVPFSTRHLRAMAYREQILLLSTHSERAELTIGLLSP